MANKKDKTDLDYMVLKLKRLLSEQPNIAPKALQNIKIPVLVIGGDNEVIKTRTYIGNFRQYTPSQSVDFT